MAVEVSYGVRRHSNLPAFNTKMIEEIAKGRHGSAGARHLTHTHA